MAAPAANNEKKSLASLPPPPLPLQLPDGQTVPIMGRLLNNVRVLRDRN